MQTPVVTELIGHTSVTRQRRRLPVLQRLCLQHPPHPQQTRPSLRRLTGPLLSRQYRLSICSDLSDAF